MLVFGDASNVMGGWISVTIGLLATLLLWGTGHPVLFWTAAACTVVEFWSFGVMHNYALNLARSRRERLRESMIVEGRQNEVTARLDQKPLQPTSREIDSVPNWITDVNLLATVAVFALLIAAAVIRFV